MDFDPDDCLRRYREFARAHPEKFANPDGEIHEILHDPELIAKAQEEVRSGRARCGLAGSDTRVGVIADDPYITLLRDAVRFPDGKLGLYNRVLVPQGAAVLPLMGETVVLIRQFRHATRRWHYEAPRGIATLEHGVENDARRELEEEIGAVPRTLVPLGILHTSTGMTAETLHLFLARIDGYGEPDRAEGIASIECLAMDQFEAMIAGGDITDGATIVSFVRAKLRGLL